MLSGDNSILSKAGQARDLTGQKQIEERVSLAYNAAVMEDINNGDGKLKETTLSAELAKLFPESTINIDTETDTTGKKMVCNNRWRNTYRSRCRKSRWRRRYWSKR